MCRQTLIPATVGIAQCESPKNGDRVDPDASDEALFTMPTWKSSIQYQTSATTTFATRYGSRIDRADRDRLGQPVHQHRDPTARTVCTPMLITTYSTVTTSAFQKSCPGPFVSWPAR